MKVELHLHTMRYSVCAVTPPSQLLAWAVELGYGCVHITEHDTVWSDAELEAIRREFPQLKIMPGVELSLPEGHLVVLGTNDPAYLRTKDPAEILAMAASHD